MTCRIIQVETEEGTFLRVDGRLAGESLGDLEEFCKEARPPLTLDLEGLRWVDDRASAFLRQLIADGVLVTRASPYVALRLETERRETFLR